MTREQQQSLAILIQAADLGFRMGAYNRHSTPNAANVNIAASQMENYLKELNKEEAEKVKGGSDKDERLETKDVPGTGPKRPKG